jgi:hypothetical protein
MKYYHRGVGSPLFMQKIDHTSVAHTEADSP